MAKDFYKIIGLSDNDRGLHGEEFSKVLKSKFRQASLRYHPDRLSGKSEKEKKEAEEKFKEIAEAYEVLSDPQKRQQYDTFGTIEGSSGFSSMNMDDIINAFFKDTPFGRSSSFRTEQVRKGEDKSIRIGVTLKELYCDSTKTIKYRKFVPCSHCDGKGSLDGKLESCPYCGGRGQITQTKRSPFGVMSTTTTCPHCQGRGTYMSNPCRYCNGHGIEEKETELTVAIPTIDNFNNTYVDYGKGNACPHGEGPNGDLYYSYRLAVNDYDEFSLDPNKPYNIVTDVDVPILDCLLGGEIELKHVDGEILHIKINPLSDDGMVYTVKNRGLKNKNGQRGNLSVVTHILLPKKLTEQEKTILRNLKNSPSFR